MPKETGLKEFFLELKLSDKILVSLLTAGALAEEALDILHQFSPRSVTRSLYTNEDFSNLNKDKRIIRNTLLRLAARKLIEIERVKKEKSVRLTEKGLNTLFTKFPKIKYKDWEWDGRWRVIIYDIEEETRHLRERLRVFLKSRDFNPVQRSVWFSPYPVEKELIAFLKKENLWDKIMVFKTTLEKNDSAKLIKTFYPNLASASKWATIVV